MLRMRSVGLLAERLWVLERWSGAIGRGPLPRLPAAKGLVVNVLAFLSLPVCVPR